MLSRDFANSNKCIFKDLWPSGSQSCVANGWDQIVGWGKCRWPRHLERKKVSKHSFPRSPAARTHSQSEGPPCTGASARRGCDARSLSLIPTARKKDKKTQRLSEDTMKSNQRQKEKKRKQRSMYALGHRKKSFYLFLSGTRKTIQSHKVLFSFVIIYYYFYYYYLL